MKVKFRFKTPDVIDDAVACNELCEADEKRLRDIAPKWVKWGEYLYVEIDTETGEAKVLLAKG